MTDPYGALAAGYPIQAVRAHFPALSDGTAYFDGPGGSQVPDIVGAAVHRTLVSGISNRGRTTGAERRADDTVTEARAAVADLLGADPRGVVFGRSMTQLTFDFARTLAKGWGPGDEVVVSRLDHDANVRPWIHAAAAVGASVGWIEFDRATGELTADHVAAALTESTRLVALTGASNLIGTRPDLAVIAPLVHAAEAQLYVDGVHLTPHAPVDLAETGADFYACSPYKFLGPHCGILAASPEQLERLRPDKLLPATDQIPERFEFGTLPYELLAGTTAAIDFLAEMAPEVGTDRRPERLRSSLATIEAYEDGLRTEIETALDELPGVTRYSRAGRRTPTLLLSFDRHDPRDVQRALAEHHINAPAGSFYALEASRWLGLGDAGGLRVGLAPYNDRNDVDRLLTVLHDLLQP